MVVPDDGFGENGMVLMIKEESDRNGFVETLDHGFKITRIKGESQGGERRCLKLWKSWGNT